MLFVASIINFGFVNIREKTRCLSTFAHEKGFSKHPLLSDLYIMRWKQIKLYLSVEYPDEDENHKSDSVRDLHAWYHKVVWLFTHVISAAQIQQTFFPRTRLCCEIRDAHHTQ